MLLYLSGVMVKENKNNIPNKSIEEIEEGVEGMGNFYTSTAEPTENPMYNGYIVSGGLFSTYKEAKNAATQWDDDPHAIIIDMSNLTVELIRGAVTPFVPGLDQRHPGWKLKK